MCFLLHIASRLEYTYTFARTPSPFQPYAWSCPQCVISAAVRCVLRERYLIILCDLRAMHAKRSPSRGRLRRVRSQFCLARAPHRPRRWQCAPLQADRFRSHYTLPFFTHSNVVVVRASRRGAEYSANRLPGPSFARALFRPPVVRVVKPIERPPQHVRRTT